MCSTRIRVYLVSCEVNNMRNMMDSRPYDARPGSMAESKIKVKKARGAMVWETRKMIIDYPIRIANQYDGRNAPKQRIDRAFDCFIHIFV